MAEWIAPDGMLDVIDLHQEMLDHTMGRAGEQGVATIEGTRGDARKLPHLEGTFDVAFMTAVLGEIPAQHAALRELARPR